MSACAKVVPGEHPSRLGVCDEKAASIPSLVAFLVLVVGGGVMIGFATLPGEWYAALQKPWFNPPNWIFGPAWTILYVLVAIAGWRTWRRRSGGTSMAIWWTQLALNFAWSPTFFGLHMIALALVVIVALLVAAIAFMIATRSVDGLSALLFVPMSRGSALRRS